MLFKQTNHHIPGATQLSFSCIVELTVDVTTATEMA
jgi:hypothetical protein